MEQDFGPLPSMQIKKGIEQLNLQIVPNCSASLRDPTYGAFKAWTYLTGKGKAKSVSLAREPGIPDPDTRVHRFHQMPAHVQAQTAMRRSIAWYRTGVGSGQVAIMCPVPKCRRAGWSALFARSPHALICTTSAVFLLFRDVPTISSNFNGLTVT
jgi:hypothetical protein